MDFRDFFKTATGGSASVNPSLIADARSPFFTAKLWNKYGRYHTPGI